MTSSPSRHTVPTLTSFLIQLAPSLCSKVQLLLESSTVYINTLKLSLSPLSLGLLSQLNQSHAMRWSAVALAGPLLQAALSAASSLTPPVLPLTVRNPYFSAWLANARDVPWSKWPIFWTGEEIGFSLLAQVPSAGTVYPLLGRPQDSLRRDSGAKYDQI